MTVISIFVVYVLTIMFDQCYQIYAKIIES